MPVPRVLVDPHLYDAAIFDLDGVVTDTAGVHAAAWKQLFDNFLARRAACPGEDHRPFSGTDYLRLVDGKPRLDGARDFLASRGVALPTGSAFDPAGDTSVHALARRKDALFLQRVARGGASAFPDTVALVVALRQAGIRTAVFSASRHCARVLDTAGLDGLFEQRVDGVTATELGLPGKPHPAVLLEATRRLGSAPSRTIVFEDAEVGVRAGQRGGFALVIGVDRTGHGARLRQAGADVVVADLAQVDVLPMRSGTLDQVR